MSEGSDQESRGTPKQDKGVGEILHLFLFFDAVSLVLIAIIKTDVGRSVLEILLAILGILLAYLAVFIAAAGLLLMKRVRLALIGELPAGVRRRRQGVMDESASASLALSEVANGDETHTDASKAELQSGCQPPPEDSGSVLEQDSRGTVIRLGTDGELVYERAEDEPKASTVNPGAKP